MPLDQLIRTLVAEHRTIKSGLSTVGNAVEAGDFELAKRTLSEVDSLFRQHIADEEGQILRLLLDSQGREASEDAIRVFRQHRPIYELMRSVSFLASLQPDDLSRNQDDLRQLLETHTLAEEGWIFPRASKSAPKH